MRSSISYTSSKFQIFLPSGLYDDVTIDISPIDARLHSRPAVKRARFRKSIPHGSICIDISAHFSLHHVHRAYLNCLHLRNWSVSSSGRILSIRIGKAESSSSHPTQIHTCRSQHDRLHRIERGASTWRQMAAHSYGGWSRALGLGCSGYSEFRTACDQIRPSYRRIVSKTILA
jgi:hypothetical protein